jgi:trans-aconitate methyltransferase
MTTTNHDNTSTANRPSTKWDARLYDDKHSFVFKYGEDVVHQLAPQQGERILDLGCGTGYLTNLIAQAGARVVGIDKSASMIERAKAAYPDLDFQVRSATDFHFDPPFDAIFSNATLHWVLDKDSAIDNIYQNLRPGGRLMLEMGGKGNVEEIVVATRKALTRHGYYSNAATQVWYFPSVGEYTTLLEKEASASVLHRISIAPPNCRTRRTVLRTLSKCLATPSLTISQTPLSNRCSTRSRKPSAPQTIGTKPGTATIKDYA